MPEEVSVVVASEQVDVLAPPAEIRVSVGVGSQGQRGSRFYAGTQTPVAFFAAIGETPNVFDLYLNTTSQQMFQFVSTPTGNVWSMLFDLSSLISDTIASSVLSAIGAMFNITSPVNGQTLQYSSSEGKWVNA